MLPCLRRLPEGWTVGGFNARKGQTRLWLTVGRENRTALTVVLPGNAQGLIVSW